MTAQEIHDPLEELQRENDVLVNVLTRILEVAELLKAGADVPPDEVSGMLRWLDQYLAVHARRLDQDLMPYARRVAMEGCFPHLDKVLKDHKEGQRRTSEALKALEVYGRDPPGSRAHLAELLEGLATKDHETTVYEGDYPLSCLLTVLPDDSAELVAERFRETQPAIEELEGGLARVLAPSPGERGPKPQTSSAKGGYAATVTPQTLPGLAGTSFPYAPPQGRSTEFREATRGEPGVGRPEGDPHGPDPAGQPPRATAEPAGRVDGAEEGRRVSLVSLDRRVSRGLPA